MTNSSPVVDTAAALIIGAELLSGKIRDENLYALSQTLRALGVRLRRVIFCPDERDLIARDVAALSRDHDLLITSGGVGPTHDDVTMGGIADALGKTVVESAEMRSLLERAYGARLTDSHLLMARVPKGARLVETKDVRWPTVVVENVWILPGVPELFRTKLAILRDHVRGPQPFFTRSVYCTLEEGELKPSLDEVVSRHQSVEVGSYPKWFDPHYKTRLTIDGRTLQDVTLAEAHLLRLLGSTVTKPPV